MRFYLMSLVAHCLSQHLCIFKLRPICLHCNRSVHGAGVTKHCVLQCKVWSHSVRRSGLHWGTSSWQDTCIPRRPPSFLCCTKPTWWETNSPTATACSPCYLLNTRKPSVFLQSSPLRSLPYPLSPPCLTKSWPTSCL
jgi:hypothetical protein